jgi:hypothetical protein
VPRAMLVLISSQALDLRDTESSAIAPNVLYAPNNTGGLVLSLSRGSLLIYEKKSLK